MQAQAWRVMAAAVVCLAGGLGSAWAQDRLPDPPPMQPDGPAMPEKAVNLGDFLAAYKRAGSPRMLIYSDLVGVSAGAAKTLNDAGTVTRLGARLEDLFRDPEVQIVEPGSMEALNEQQMETLRRNDSYAAARALGKAANADVVLYMRMVEQVGRNAPYTGTYVLADLRRGTTLGRYAWDMVPGPNGEFDAARMTEYARSIARRAIDQFAEAFPEGGSMGSMRRFTIRVVGDYEPDDLSGLRDALNAATGVKPGSVILRAEDTTGTSRVATFEVAYSGELIDLRQITRRAVVDQMGMEATPIDAREGSIGLKLAPLSLSSRERMLSGGIKTGRNTAARDRLTLAYANAGKPTVAVMFNKATVESEAALPVDGAAPAPVQTGDGVNIILGERVKVGPGGASSGFAERALDREIRDRREERKQDAAIDMRVFEDKVAERLLQLGLQPRDISLAQTELLGKPEFRDRSWTDRELAYTLGKQAGADVVISGVGRVVRDRTSDGPQRVVLSMRAYSVGTGDVLAAASVQRSITPGGESYGQAVEELAAEATAKLVTQMSDRWEAMPRK